MALISFSIDLGRISLDLWRNRRIQEGRWADVLVIVEGLESTISSANGAQSLTPRHLRA